MCVRVLCRGLRLVLCVRQVFYIYLYSCSILFLLYVYIFLLKDATVTETGSTSKLSKLSSASMSRISESRVGEWPRDGIRRQHEPHR